MECLTSLVGVDNGCIERVAGRKYINDLPGFEFSLANCITNSEEQTAEEILNKCITNAADELEDEARAFIDPRVRMASLVDNGTIGFYDDHRQIKAAETGYLGGINVEVPIGHYVADYIKSVTIFTPNTYTNQNLYIYDLTRGLLLDTIEFDSVGGEYSEIPVNTKYKSNGQFINLFICYDAGLGTSYKSDIVQGGCGSCGWRKYPMNNWMEARTGRILSADNKILSNLRSSSHCYGLSVNYQIICDSGNFICATSPRLKMSMFYKAGIKVMDEFIYQRIRLNSQTTTYLNKAKELKKEYSEKYDKSMGNVLGNLAFPNDICFECEPIIQVKSST